MRKKKFTLFRITLGNGSVYNVATDNFLTAVNVAEVEDSTKRVNELLFNGVITETETGKFYKLSNALSN